MKRKALGKGLDSLIPKTPPKQASRKATSSRRSSKEQENFLEIDIDRIRPNRNQPRRKFDAKSLENLAKSLNSNGFIQPIAVRRIEKGRFEIVAGERRWRAAQIAGLLRIPAVVHELAEERLLEFALIENLQREDLNPLDEALAYRTLLDDFGLTQQEVASRVGKRRATVANMLRLLGLAAPVQEKVRSGAIAMGHARALAALDSPRDQVEVAARIEAGDLSVRQVEAMVARMTAERAPLKSRGARKRDPNVEAAEEKLQSILGTRVRIVQGRKGGRLELHYFDDEELQRIYSLVYDAATARK